MLAFSKEIRNKKKIIIGEPVALSDEGVVYLYTEEVGKDPAQEIETTNTRILPSISKTENQPKRDVIYISAPSGAGKSTLAANYIKDYHRIYPKNKIYIFTNSRDDPVFNDIKQINQVDIVDINLLDDQTETRFPLELFKNSLVVFDDAEAFDDIPQHHAYALVKKMLYAGRKLFINMVVTSHDLLSGSAAAGRQLKSELTTAVIFPKASSNYQITRFSKEYLGLDTRAIKELTNIKSRWVAFRRGYPQILIYENGVELVNK